MEILSPLAQETLEITDQEVVDRIWQKESFINRGYFDFAGIAESSGENECELSRQLKSGPVLEVGSGRGYLVEDLINCGIDCIGIDLEYLGKSKKHLRYAKADNLPFEENRFQTIINCCSALNYARSVAELKKMIDEQLRVVKKGGKIYIYPAEVSSSIENKPPVINILAGNIRKIEKHELPLAFAIRRFSGEYFLYLENEGLINLKIGEKIYNHHIEPTTMLTITKLQDFAIDI
jgi:SAM-dependent methyltransferase